MRYWVALLILALGLPALAAGDWRTARLAVVPGKQAGPIRLGQPLSPEVFRVLGPPTVRQAPQPGPDGMDSGNVSWGGPARSELVHGINVKLNDGVGDDHVFTVYLLSVRAVTDRGVYMGCRLRQARKAYPEARVLGPEEIQTYSSGLGVPGLTMLFRGDRLEEMSITRRP